MRPPFAPYLIDSSIVHASLENPEPEAGATQALCMVPPAIAELKPSALYGLDPQKLAGFEKWFVVHRLGLAEKQAGAQLQDMGIVCLLPGKIEFIDANLSFKARENFRGVYVSKSSRLKCYYFNPSYVKRGFAAVDVCLGAF